MNVQCSNSLGSRRIALEPAGSKFKLLWSTVLVFTLPSSSSNFQPQLKRVAPFSTTRMDFFTQALNFEDFLTVTLTH